ncbi:transcriptional regulator [Azorhizobium caulinodans ORS 571]|uniref:Transcriptional regulator n=1 Tax=Azorhizobium caulinodans (strain ATCC 43989 / DSM 5975 / JCM 20966 / LMG 6465 / NBRC 14845 / NCIMB 13405 / ORS 571) TaxID=438753 RepID=A8I396_AZOC5|nr:LysR family transcriptional regulator [Azorhizobium caulinodans]BAF87995.1 transcriptional regulator [Azorhizobium caulinodans ORS 571]
MDQLAAMRCFIGVVEAGTFSRASTVLRVPKATLTKNVQALEAHLRTKLLHRTTRRVTVTPDGEAYYERAVRLLADLEDLDSTMAVSQANPQGRLRVDISAALATMLLIPALPDFHARYPDIQIDLGVTDDVVDLLGENVDCVIRAGQLADQSLVARRIGEMHSVLVAAPGYLEAHGTPAHPLDLETSHRAVGYFKPRMGRSLSLTLSKDADEAVEVNGRYMLAVSDSNAYITAAMAGIGIAMMPVFMARPHIESGALVPVLTEWRAPAKPIYAVFPPSRHLSNRLRVFVDWVAALVARTDFGMRDAPAKPREAAVTSPRISVVK